ncbi:hypothetical protein HanIR_Chr08g0374541 [Helianthus annuus]|nr:hypothetical protein HanIR_Chr08g0374541 [Helianthus annuus]
MRRVHAMMCLCFPIGGFCIAVSLLREEANEGLLNSGEFSLKGCKWLAYWLATYLLVGCAHILQIVCFCHLFFHLIYHIMILL